MTTAPRPAVRDDARGMSTRTVRTVQLQLGAVILVTVGVVAAVDAITNPNALVLGLAAAAIATAAALLVPWHRLPFYATALVPAIDIVAIGLLRDSSPPAGFSLLWTFPVIWSAWAYGLVGSISSVAVVSVAYWLMTASTPTAQSLAFRLMFPAVLAMLAGITRVNARRAQAQRVLLQRQALALRNAAGRAHRQESLVTEVLDSVDFSVVAFTPDGSVLITNDAAARLQRTRDSSGDAVYDADGFTPLEPAARVEERARRGETFSNVLSWYGDPGSDDRRALQVTARPLTGPAGEGVGRVVVAREVTDEQLALRARDDLVASVSHELRTPLTSIVGYLDLVEDDPTLSASARHNVQVAQRNAERLLALVADVLAVSAASRMGIDIRIERKAIDLAEVVEAAIEAAEVRARERSMTIDSTAVEPCPARADPHRIRQVVDNLIGNAVKYGREGGRIEIGCTTDDHHAWIVVRDDGPGITSHDQARLFERFFRSLSVRNTSTHGSGLGLAISRDIVRAHGGDITVTSTVGAGATFVVRLPLTSPEESS